MRKLYFALAMIFCISSTSSYALGVIRIKCADADTGAKIYLNNVYKGECPADIIVDAGNYALFLTRSVGDYEHYLEKNITVVDNVPQRLNLALSESRLTAKAKKRVEEEEKQQREADFLAQKNAANQGDLQAMRTLADYYEQGHGVKRSAKEAKQWRDKAEKIVQQERLTNLIAQGKIGDVNAMQQLVSIYKTGNYATPASAEEAQYWQQQLDQKSATLAVEAQNEDKAKRIAERKKKMMPVSGSFVGWLLKDNNVSSGIATIMTLSPFILLSAISDLPATTYQAVKIQEIKNEAVLRSSAFAQPNSLLAKAQSKQSTAQ